MQPNKINYNQHKLLNALLAQTGLTPFKNELVLSYTNGRSESRADLTYDEAQAFINYLKSLDVHAAQCEQMRRKILSMAHKLQWENADGTVNMNSVNNWCIEHGYLKKKLNEHAYNELPKLVSQFQSMYKYYINKTETI